MEIELNLGRLSKNTTSNGLLESQSSFFSTSFSSILKESKAEDFEKKVVKKSENLYVFEDLKQNIRGAENKETLNENINSEKEKESQSKSNSDNEFGSDASQNLFLNIKHIQPELLIQNLKPTVQHFVSETIEIIKELKSLNEHKVTFKIKEQPIRIIFEKKNDQLNIKIQTEDESLFDDLKKSKDEIKAILQKAFDQENVFELSIENEGKFSQNEQENNQENQENQDQKNESDDED